MNILEAFEESDKIEKKSKPLVLKLDKGYIDSNSRRISIEDIRSNDWQPIIEPLTFQKIKRKCIPNESLLLDEVGQAERLYLGFNREGRLVTDMSSGTDCLQWSEKQIKDWKVSDKTWNDK